jgi:glutathione synthase/RimK-type ligase-like ATP-grasp enzyme
LRDAIQAVCGKRIPITYKPGKVVTMRYGCSLIGENTVKDTEINSPEFIHLVANKGLLSNKLLENSISTIEFHRITQEIPELPVIIRRTLSSYGGRGIEIARTKEEFSGIGYWTKIIKMEKEYRIHIVDGKIIKVFSKVRESTLPPEEIPIRNMHRGYHYSLIREPFPKMKEFVDSLSFLNGVFYAADIGWDVENKRYVLIEINSAPGLNEETARLYSEAICPKLEV